MLLLSGKNELKNELSLKVIGGVNLLKSKEEATALVESLFERAKPVVLSFINAHAYNMCCSDAEFNHALLKSDILLRDGIGMQILYRSIGLDSGANLNGTDYIPVLLDRYKGKRLALLGTEMPYLIKAAKSLAAEGHTIVLTETGYHTPEHYLALVRDANPEIVVLGMGMPKQEKLSILLKENIGNSCLIINGGAILDHWGKKVRRAPLWIRSMKMEWFFRFLMEPRRLFARYIIGNYIFLKRTRDLKKYVYSQARQIITHNLMSGHQSMIVKKVSKTVDSFAEMQTASQIAD